MKKRQSISKRKRFDIFKRDRFVCQYCGRRPPEVVLELDHVIPVSRGGGNDTVNLITACMDCNRGKSDGDMAAVPMAVDVELAARRERFEQVKELNKFLMQERRELDKSINELGRHWYSHDESTEGKYVFGPTRVASIRTFLQHLPAAVVFDAIDIAMSRKPIGGKGFDYDTWKYFCGICWRMIKGDGHYGDEL